jgi:hypothetical protein
MKNRIRAFVSILALGVIAAGWLWALFALVLFPGWNPWGHGLAAVAWIGGTLLAWRWLARRGRWAAVAGIAAAVAAVALVFLSTVRPRNDRDWTADEARLPKVAIDAGGGRVTVRDLRFVTYRTTADYDVHWYDQTFDLDRIATVDFVVEPFASWRGPAHTFLTFGFDGGEHVAVSVEIRKERGESYSPLAGLFRRYELIYVLGDERDLIGLRANVRHDPVYLFPIRATRGQVRALFLSMAGRAEQLEHRPEFYNTLTSTCTTNILRHVNELRDEAIPAWDLRVLLPGYSDDLAWKLGLIEAGGTLEEARRRFRINGRSAFGPGGADAADWSRQIRQR